MKKNKGLWLAGVFSLLLAVSLAFLPLNTDTAKAEDEHPGLDFYLINNSTAYTVCSDGTDVEEIVIPAEYDGKPVTNIMNAGFMFCDSLVSVEIPESVVEIEDYAFSDCPNLTDVYIAADPETGKGVKIIGDEAFAYCNLQGPIIPWTVTEDGMGDGVFDGNPDSGSLYIRRAEAPTAWAAKLANYEGEIVYGEDNIVFGEETDASGNIYAYSVKKYQNISTKDSLVVPCHYKGLPVVNIKQRAFNGSVLSSFSLESACNHGLNVPSLNIESAAFANSQIDNIVLNNDVTFYSKYGNPSEMSTIVFNASKAQSITLPNNMQKISEGMFRNCASLRSILTTEDSPNRLLSTITKLESNAFLSCTSLKYLYVPNTVTTVGENVFGKWTSEQTIEFGYDELPKNWPKNWNGGNARIKLQKLTLTFNANLEGAAPQETKLYTKKDITLSDITEDMPVPTHESKEFTGKWYRDMACENEISPNEILSDDITLYAGWVEKKYKIVLEDNEYVEYTVSPENCSSFEQNGDEYTFIHGGDLRFTIEVKDKYNQTNKSNVRLYLDDFNHEIAPSGDIFAVMNITSNHTVKVKALPINQYTVSLITSGTITQNTEDYTKESNGYSRVYKYGEYIEQPVCYLRGHIDKGWRQGQDDFDFSSVVVTSQLTLTQKWEARKYKVSVDYAGYMPNADKVIEYGANTSQLGTINTGSVNRNFDGWYLDRAFTKPVPTAFDVPNDSQIDSAPNADGISAFFRVYAKVKIIAKNSLFDIGNDCTSISVSSDDVGNSLRLSVPATRTKNLLIVFDNYNARTSAAGANILTVYASNIHVEIIFKGTNVLQAGNGKNGLSRSALKSASRGQEGGNGGHAIYAACNLTISGLDGAFLTLRGGNGGEGSNTYKPDSSYKRWTEGCRGGNGGSAIYALKDVSFENIRYGEVRLIGGNGGNATYLNNDGEFSDFPDAGSGGDAAIINGNTLVRYMYETKLVIQGGEGGWARDGLVKNYGNGGKGGSGINSNSITFRDINNSNMSVHGGKAGFSATLERSGIAKGGYGILCTDTLSIQYLNNVIVDIAAGQSMQETLSGGIGIKSKTLSFYNNTYCEITVTGGDGSIGDSQPGNGGAPITVNNMACIYNTGTAITFKGGMGGANRNSDYGGEGYKFSTALRALYEPKGITCIDGEDYRAGNSTT